MSQHDDLDRSLARWFEAVAPPAATADVLDRALRATRGRRPRPRLFADLGSHWGNNRVGATAGGPTLGRTGLRASMTFIVLLLLVALFVGALLVGARLLQPAPVTGQLVLHLQTWSQGIDPDFVELAVYADGRVIWITDERVGYVEQRLTPEGVERLRSKAISTGLFERDRALGIDGVGWGNIKVRGGERLVIVAWGQNRVNVSGLGLEDRFVRATSAQAVEVTKLEAFLRDPVTWALPDEVYKQWEVTPFVPSHLWVSYDRSRPDLSKLPPPAREVATRILEPLFLGRCQNISLDQAREIAQVLAQAGIIAPDYDVRLGYAFTVPSSTSFVHAHPALPHDIGAVCGVSQEPSVNPPPMSPTVAPSPSVAPTSIPSLSPKVTELLNGFLKARVAGLGAGNFLGNPSDAVPLLYATSSGASYDRGEFERVLRIEWPYGWTAFKVRMFAGDTVVEQLFFTSLSGPGGLHYPYDGFRTDIAPTTENGQPVGVLSTHFDTYFDGEVTMQAVHPWVGSQLIPEGVGPTTDGGERNGWRRLIVKAVPASCQPSGPASAEGVAQSIRSDPDLQATPPVAVSAGGANALMMDVVTAAGTNACGLNFPAGDRTRLYLIDAPEGSSMRVLAIAIAVPEASFARAVAPAASMVDSIEFHTP